MAEHGFERVASLEAETEAEADRVHAHASYGKACLNCVRSKTKCARSGSRDQCERCHRLRKDCQPGPTVRKKRVSRKSTSASIVVDKTAALEEKLDGIVQMLQRSQGPQTQNLASSSSSIPATSQLQDQSQNNGFDSSTFNNRNFASSGLDTLSKAAQHNANYSSAYGPPTPATSCISTVPDTNLRFSSRAINSPSSVANGYPLEDDDELDQYLETYRTKMVPYFPIVQIEPEITVKDMREKRPFLWLVIRAICSKNVARQARLGREVRKRLANEMILEGVKSLDMLQGVLVFASWGHYYICFKPVISTILQLGMSLAYDLGLTKPIPTEPVGVLLNYSAQGCPKPINGVVQVRTIEERRTAIGLFLISSVTANYFQRIEPMRWSPYLDECLRLLEQRNDYATDELLVYLVRIQMICNKVHTIPWNDLLGDGGSKVPQDFFVKSLNLQVEELRQSIPPELNSNQTLKLHILNTVLSIHEHSLSTYNAKNIPSDPNTQLQRIENLWTCLTTIKSWFSTFYSLDTFPLTCYTNLSMEIFAQMSHCIVALFRISTFEAPGVPWDRQRVREELDLAEVLKIWTQRWEAVPAAAGLDTSDMTNKDDDIWASTMTRLVAIRSWWEMKLQGMIAADSERDRRIGMGENGSADGFGTSGQQQQMEALDFGALNMDFMDDAWMRDILGGGCDFTGEAYL